VTQKEELLESRGGTAVDNKMLREVVWKGHSVSEERRIKKRGRGGGEQGSTLSGDLPSGKNRKPEI